MRLRKVVRPPWKPSAERAPWSAGYLLPWGEWLREWETFCWVIPCPRPTDMRYEPYLWP